MNFQTVDSQNRAIIQFYSSETNNKVYRFDILNSDILFQQSTNGGSSFSTLWSLNGNNVINRTISTSIRDALASSSTPLGLSSWGCQNATDNPIGKGNIATALIFKHNMTGIWSYIWLFGGNGQIHFTSVSGTLPSSLTWSKKI